MKIEDKITRQQLMATATVCLLAPAIRLLPVSSVRIAGRAAWVSPIIGVIFGVLYVCLLEKLTENRQDNEGLTELIIRGTGTAVGKIIAAIFGLWLVFYSAVLVRSAAERMLSSVYVSGNIYVFVVVMLLAALLIAYGNVQSLARTGQAFVLIILSILGVVLIFSLKDMKINNLLPVTYKDTGNILLAAIPAIDVFGAFVYFLFLSKHLVKHPKDRRVSVKWILVLGAEIFLVQLTTIGNLSAEYIQSAKSAFFLMIRNTVLFNVVERIEAVVIAVWVLTDVLYLATIFIIAREQIGSVVNIKNDKKLLIPIAVISYVITIYMAFSEFDMRLYSEEIVPLANMFLAFVVVPTVLIIGKIRKRI